MAAVAAMASPAILSAQIVQMGSPVNVGEKFKDLPALPTPRMPDGRVNLGVTSGQLGLWFPLNGVTERLVNPDDVSAADAARFVDRPLLRDIPFQPWARELYSYRRGNQFEPHSRCKPSAGPRQFLTPYGVDRLGLPHTDQLHMIERFTRTDSKTMKYQVTIEDFGAYTAVWSGGFLLGWSPEEELFEYICQDNNLAPGLLMGSEKSVDRNSTIVP